MELLQPNEYDASYFDGHSQRVRHNAGYYRYKRWARNAGENSTGEFYKDIAQRLDNKYNLSGKKILEIGCAKGFIVEDLREFGADAYGLDISSYAIGEASPLVQPYLTVGDIRTSLSGYTNNEFDGILSLRTLECLSDLEIPLVITEMNRIANKQIHIIEEEPNPRFYNAHPISWWANLGFKAGTILAPQGDETNFIII